MIVRLLLFLCLLTGVSSSFALDVPKLQGYVNDRAGLLSSATRRDLEKNLAGFEKSDSTQVVLLTIPTLEGEVLEEYSIRVAEAWKIGQKGKDNGVIILVARDERQVRIEVGYGLEGRLTDLMSGRIIDNEMVPYFRKGDYDGGIRAGVAAVIQAVRGEYQGSGKTTGKRSRNGIPLDLIILAILIGPGILGSLFGSRHRGRRGHWGGGFGGGFGGGGFGGGGFSGGGGGFGGGGASGRW